MILAPLLFVAQARSLAAYLEANPLAGAWIAVGAESVTAPGGANLAAFGRRTFSVGTLTVVAPITSVAFHDPTGAAPDLAEGLPRGVKVLRLLARLSQAEWRKVGDQGLGVNDLQGEKRALLASILPKRSVKIIGSERKEGPAPNRLRVRRGVMAEISSANGRNYMFQDLSQPSASGTLLDEAESRYGVRVRETVANRPKPSDLKYADPRLDRRVVGGETLGKTMEVISRATGVPLIADVRVAGLSVRVSGGPRRAGDLLQALALAVTGTFRKVGDTYLMTGDLDGAGARLTRFALWERSFHLHTRALEDEAQSAIFASGGLAQTSVETGGAPLADDLRQSLDTPSVRGKAERTDVDRLPTSWRESIESLREIVVSKTDELDFTRVGLRGVPEFEFILPDGTVLSGGSLGLEALPPPPLPNRLPVRSTRPAPLDAPKTRLTIGSGSALLVAVASAAEAAQAAKLAQEFGFEELWLETQDADAIRGAGRPVRLVVRPWNVLPGETALDPDRTILGQTSPNRAAVAPGSEQANQRIAQFQKLQTAPNVVGSVLLDASPLGYSRNARRFPELADELGYNVVGRLDFLRENGVDPLDLPPGGERVGVDLANPFFPGQESLSAGSTNASSVQRLPAEWNASRERSLQTAMASLGKVVGDPPVQTESVVSSLVGSERYPLSTLRQGGRRLTILPPSVLPSLGTDGAFRVILAGQARRQGGVVFDLSAIPAARRGVVLERFLMREPASPSSGSNGP